MHGVFALDVLWSRSSNQLLRLLNSVVLYLKGGFKLAKLFLNYGQ